MTSPELPYIEGGTIWDGVTQYYLGMPPGVRGAAGFAACTWTVLGVSVIPVPQLAQTRL